MSYAVCWHGWHGVVLRYLVPKLVYLKVFPSEANGFIHNAPSPIKSKHCHLTASGKLDWTQLRLCLSSSNARNGRASPLQPAETCRQRANIVLSMLLKHAESYQCTREIPCKAGLVLLEMVPALVQPVGLQGQARCTPVIYAHHTAEKVPST